MSKKDKKHKKNKHLENNFGVLIDGRPMSQIIPWALIITAAAMFGAQIMKAREIIEGVCR